MKDVGVPVKFLGDPHCYGDKSFALSNPAYTELKQITIIVLSQSFLKVSEAVFLVEDEVL